MSLAYVEEATRSKRVTDGTFDELGKYFNYQEIVVITILSAIQNFENPLNIPLGIDSDGLRAIAQTRKLKRSRYESLPAMKMVFPRTIPGHFLCAFGPLPP